MQLFAEGKYKPSESTEPCVLCPQDTYNSNNESISQQSCVACPEGSTTNKAVGSKEITACKCSLSTYQNKGLQNNLQCLSCPDGAVCEDLDGRPCAFSSTQVQTPLCPIVGNWTFNSVGERFLESCWPGYSKVNSESGSRGKFVAQLQKCKRCDEQYEYIISDSDNCQR